VLIIEATGVRKLFDAGAGNVAALRGVDFSVKRGEMVAIMGPSGCGKTTLLNCLSGLDEPTSGDIIIAGTNIKRLSDHQRTAYRAKQMGFIFQSFNLLPVLSAVENVELPMLISGESSRKARRRALEMLDVVGLSDRARHRPAELSGGQQQRVTIARALVNNPAIVWGDEPTGNLDGEAAEHIMDLLCKLNREQGQTLVIVTHSAEVGARAGRIVKMRDGQVLKN
jgi:ABC-type lipoprotein export system ATPase subunit